MKTKIKVIIAVIVIALALGASISIGTIESLKANPFQEAPTVYGVEGSWNW